MIARKMLRQIFHQFKRLGLAVAVDRGDDKERLGKWRQVVFKPFPRQCHRRLRGHSLPG